MYLNDDIEDTEKPDGICSPTFAEIDFLGLFLHQSISSLNNLRSA